MSKSLLVDGSNILIRAVKATERSGMSVGDIPTGALHAFIMSLAKHMREIRPTHIAVCWDGGRSNYRLSVYDGYKARRASHDGPNPVEGVFTLAKTFLVLTGFWQVEHDGWEADDLIARYWRQRDAQDETVILSGDKDFFQLLDINVTQVCPGDPEPWDYYRCINVMCRPEYIPMVMALTGDAGDDVPGVPGVGNKTAIKLLDRNGWDLGRTIDNEPRLKDHRDEIMRNLALVDLRTEYCSPGALFGPVPFHPLGLTGPTGTDLQTFLRHYEMATIEARLRHGALWSETPSS